MKNIYKLTRRRMWKSIERQMLSKAGIPHEINEKTNQNRIMCPQHASHLNIACFEERRFRFVHPRRTGHRWLQLQLLARKEHRALPPAGIAHVVVVDLHAVVREVVVQYKIPMLAPTLLITAVHQNRETDQKYN